ncbi:PaaI family thioesterase [Leifsonia aquatica]|uniref:PaaI family thioesterase n=1 Tax=Leifsonia aquatica TaxID=144185 RepID=UPI000469E201|nr:hotdog fold thioesterase [Leifsonia aquatica]
MVDGDAAGGWTIELGELDEKMGVRILEQSAERVVATMPVEGNRQSFGLLHGGASVAFAEALGSWAAVIHAGPGRSAVGVDINATHHKSARSGLVTGVATAIRLGRTIASHEIVVTDENGDRLCTARITNLIVDAPGR